MRVKTRILEVLRTNSLGDSELLYKAQMKISRFSIFGIYIFGFWGDVVERNMGGTEEVVYYKTREEANRDLRKILKRDTYADYKIVGS